MLAVVWAAKMMRPVLSGRSAKVSDAWKAAAKIRIVPKIPLAKSAMSQIAAVCSV
jgi:hypothetical protein